VGNRWVTFSAIDKENDMEDIIEDDKKNFVLQN